LLKAGDRERKEMMLSVHFFPPKESIEDASSKLEIFNHLHSGILILD
jgi:hypothetical protein